jgi:hypothetical protein
MRGAFVMPLEGCRDVRRLLLLLLTSAWLLVLFSPVHGSWDRGIAGAELSVVYDESVTSVYDYVVTVHNLGRGDSGPSSAIVLAAELQLALIGYERLPTAPLRPGLAPSELSTADRLYVMQLQLFNSTVSAQDEQGRPQQVGLAAFLTLNSSSSR